MNDREIIDGESGGIQQIKCNHCNGTGKCNCVNCFGKSDISDKSFAMLQYLKENNMSFNCSKCNGYGFLLLKPDGTVIKPKEQK